MTVADGSTCRVLTMDDLSLVDGDAASGPAAGGTSGNGDGNLNGLDGAVGGAVGPNDDDGGEEDLLTLYTWLDGLPLPSIKRSSGIVARDFSDGTAIADIVHYYFPSYVEQHNYVKTSNTARKKANWEVLMTKVLLKRNPFREVFGRADVYGRERVREQAIGALCAGVTGADGRNGKLEVFLWRLMGCCEKAVGGGGGEVGGEVGGRVEVPVCASSGAATSSSEDGDGEEEMIKALVEENAKLSSMVIKQDGIIRLMQAKIETLERALGG